MLLKNRNEGISMTDKTNKTWQKMKEHRYMYVMLLPGVILLILMNYLPMFGSLIAFKEIDYAKGLLGSPWIGFKNFEFLFTTKNSWIAIRNTLGYNAVFILTGIMVPVALSIALNELKSKYAAKTYQVLVIMPHFISMVVVAYLLFAFLGSGSGFVNTKIMPLLGREPIRWYMEPEYWPWILFLVNGWKTWGYGTVIYLASMAGFDPQLYEAATIDGASKWKQIQTITIPLLMPIITMLFILSLGRIINSDFGLFYQVPRAAGPLINVTQTLDTLVYRSLMQIGDVGMASAAALLQSSVGFVTILSANALLRKVAPDRALF